MDNYQNIFRYAIYAAFVIVLVHFFFNKKEGFQNSEESAPQEVGSVTPVVEDVPIPAPKKYLKPTKFGKIYNFHDPHTVFPKSGSGCPTLQKNEEDTDLYIQKYALSNEPVHSIEPSDPPKHIQQFHDDFFAFRDTYTNENSSMRYDPVDKIQDLYLSGNMDEARGYPNKKIKDLFDYTTLGPNLYGRGCVRVPYFDNINPEGWKYSYGSPGTQLVADEYDYTPEKVMNGGEIRGGLAGMDPASSNFMNY